MKRRKTTKKKKLAKKNKKETPMYMCMYKTKGSHEERRGNNTSRTSNQKIYNMYTRHRTKRGEKSKMLRATGRGRQGEGVVFFRARFLCRETTTQVERVTFKQCCNVVQSILS